jgi:hypothetical protein
MTQNLTTLLSLMIPADSKRGLPSGAEIEELKYRISNGELDQLVEAANSIELLIANSKKKSLKQLSPGDFEAFVKEQRVAVNTYLRLIGEELIKSYYTDSRVQEAIGGSSRPPFPMGFPMQENNLDLLEEVFNRGPIYREVLNEH